MDEKGIGGMFSAFGHLLFDTVPGLLWGILDLVTFPIRLVCSLLVPDFLR
ncbi:MAG: hypothetical protein ACLFTT_17885 [Candidatus Hydrogenedentota bacterium]